MAAKIIDYTASHKRITNSENKIAEIEKQAIEKKMSYGQYVALIEKEKKKEF